MRNCEKYGLQFFFLCFQRKTITPTTTTQTMALEDQNVEDLDDHELHEAAYEVWDWGMKREERKEKKRKEKIEEKRREEKRREEKRREEKRREEKRRETIWRTCLFIFSFISIFLSLLSFFHF